MRRRFTQIILIAAAALALMPWASAQADQQGSGVAGGGRVARGKNDSTGTAKPRHSEPVPATSETEARPRIASSRIREIESLEQQCLEEVNRLRRRNGLTRLMFYEELLPIAREYSRRMAEEKFFSHDDPEGRSVKERVEEGAIKWRMVGENLAYSNGYVNPVAASIHGWMNSPGHRANILAPDFNLTAVGVWIKEDGTVYFTEIFLRQ